MNLYYCSINDVKSQSSDYYTSLLPHSMSRYVYKFFAEEDRNHRLLARLMLRHCLVQTTGSDILLHNWELDMNKKPIIKKWFNFSISHSGEFVIFGYDSEYIGIDIEKIENIDYLSLADYLHPDEKIFIENAINKLTSFYTIWVKKEAMLKAIGVGLINGLKSFSCVKDQVFYDNKLWLFHRIEINPGYICYYCGSQLDTAFLLKRFSLISMV